MATFREIPGYEGLYLISDEGRVFSVRSNAYIKLSVERNGYIRANLWNKGIGKHCLVHRLVAKAFLPNDSNLEMVNHKDGDKTNNSLSNLEWCDASANMRHARENGLVNPKTTPVAQYTLDGKFVRTWASIAEACNRYGLNHANVVTVCGGKTNRKQTGGYRWQYVK